jgi:hypothetical protein
MDCRVKPGNDNLDIARDLVSVPPKRKRHPGIACRDRNGV